MTVPYPTSVSDADEYSTAPLVPERERTDRETEAMLQRMVRAGLAHQKDANEKFRIDATKYYRGEKFGDEKPGRSDVVVTDVRDTVQQLLAPLMAILFGPISAVEFRPRRPEDIELAAQQTAYINYLFRDENKGFLILHGALKDALVRRMGVIKFWWEEKDEIESLTLSGLDEMGIQAALAEGGEIVREDMDPVTGEISVTLVRRHDYGCIRVAGVPTERFFYNKEAQSLGDAVLAGHWEDRTVADLVSLGYSMEELKEAVNARPQPDAETQARRPDTSTGADDAMLDENRPVRYYEAYVKLASAPGEPTQLMKACFVGESALKLVALDPADDVPFALFVPDPEPHSIEGLGVSDGTMDLQRINSDVARGVLNSLQLSITPRTAFVPGAVNLKDMLNTEVNALIRTRDIEAIRPIEHRFLGEAGIGVLEFFRGMKEDRFGTSRAAAGLNPDALQSSTPAAVAATVSASQQRVLMLAQVFAETGYKDLFAGLYRLTVRHQKQSLVVKLRGEYVPVNPAQWGDTPTMQVNVGVGAGTLEDRINSLLAIITKQEQYLSSPATAKLTNMFLLRNALAELAVLTGRVDPNRYWSTPADIQAQMEQEANQPPPPPEPEIIIAQAQVETERGKLALQEQKDMALIADNQAKLALEREKMLLEDDRERDKIEADVALRAAELEVKYNTQVDLAQIRADMARTRTAENPA